MKSTEPAAPSLFDRIAEVAHEANRAWLEVSGGPPEPRWDEAEDSQRAAAREGVQLALAGGTPRQIHELSRRRKLARGWNSSGQRSTGETLREGEYHGAPQSLARTLDPNSTVYIAIVWIGAHAGAQLRAALARMIHSLSLRTTSQVK